MVYLPLRTLCINLLVSTQTPRCRTLSPRYPRRQPVLEVVQSQLALDAPPGRQRAAEESVEDTGRRVRSLIAEYPEAVAYLARAMIDNALVGTRAFNALFAMGRERWARRADRNQLPADVVDMTWAALNPLLLALGTIVLRRHVERQLPEPFTKPSQSALGGVGKYPPAPRPDALRPAWAAPLTYDQ